MGMPLHVLIVADPRSTVLMVRALKRHDFTLSHERADTESAMRESLENSALELVIITQNLTDFGAVSPLELVRERYADLPSIVVSEVDDVESVVAAMKGGARDFIVKGRWNRLATAVRRELAEARLRRERVPAGEVTCFTGGTCARKRMEEQLRESEAGLCTSEAHYRLLVESIMDAYVRVDMEGRFVECNSMFCSMLGYSENEIYSLTIKDITPEKWHDMEMGIIEGQTLTRGYSDIYQKEYRHRDGTVFPVELRRYLFRDESGKPTGMWAIIRDIRVRKRTEKSLRESESKFRSLLVNIPDDLWTADASREIIFISRKFRKLSGYSAKEVQGGGKDFWFDRVHADDVASVREAYAQFFAHVRKYDIEYRFLKKDGSWIWVHDRAFKTYEKDGTFYTDGIITDITKRRRLQDENRVLDRELLTLYAIATRLNSTVDSRKMMKYILFQLHNMMQIDYSCIHLLSDKGLLLKNSMGLSKDIKRALRSLPMNTPWVKRVLTGKHFRTKGPIILEMPEEAAHAQDIGMSAWCAVTLKSGSDVTGILTVGHNMEKNYTEREIFLLKSVANQLAVLIENHELYGRMRDKNRELKRSKDALKKNLEDTRRANVELTRLNEAKSKFIGLASHELKTPITSSYGGLQYLLYYCDLMVSSEQHEVLISVFEGIAQLKNLVEDLLSMSRIEVVGAPVQKIVSNPIALFGEVYGGLIFPLTTRNVSVYFVEDGILIPVNDGLLRMVARNLLENAVKFTPDGGTIRVSGKLVNRLEALRYKKSLQPFYPEFSHVIDGHDAFYRLEVADTGIGIPEEEVVRVFEKFYSLGDIDHHTSGTTGFMSKGVGLGLSIVKGAMTAHDGFVWVTAGPDGVGSTFSLLFPMDN